MFCIGIDDTDSPRGMCTTYLGAVLLRRLKRAGVRVHEARLVRLNPNVPEKTRGNAAVCLVAEGSRRIAFRLACEAVEELADLSHERTHPGVVVSDGPLSPDFYTRAVQSFCTLDEALALLAGSGALFRGYKEKRGLIGATAAVCSRFDDATYEVLVYRSADRFGTPRSVDRQSLFDADRETFPHTWDTVDRGNDLVVCVPHTPDPVLFGIRGERPGWIALARERVISERPACEQVWVTNQGTDAHIVPGTIGSLAEGHSYLVGGTVCAPPQTFLGGHVCLTITDGTTALPCMAYEPTRGFRDVVRSLLPGDVVRVCGSYKRGSINLEKLAVDSAPPITLTRPPVCERCGKRMTSAGKDKGYKCRRCGGRSDRPIRAILPRTVSPGWYEVPPSARRHLARPLCRGVREDFLRPPSP
ncbi:MAG: tRNA(Ile)(2)-agmatinylcytidine synthase [Methanolinea sp.]|nr:tRNA(Ile)(2)-agmatinylcytidine synthase [Methanolinea sp.]